MNTFLWYNFQPLREKNLLEDDKFIHIPLS